MPSSTKIPTTKIIPKRVIILMVKPIIPAIINIPKNENGIPNATHKDNRKLKNNPNINKTNINPIKPLEVNKSILSFKEVANSY